MRSHRLRFTVARSLAVGVAVAVVVCGVLSAPPAGAGTMARTATTARTAAAAGATHTGVLLNGDRVLTSGKNTVIIPAGTATGADSTVRVSLGGQTYVIPDTALPYIGRGLDLSLFNVAKLPRGGTLPVTITYSGSTAPKLSGVTITRASGGTASGYLTAAGAKTFGGVLLRQFAKDHATGSYGTDGIFAGGTSISLAGAGQPIGITPHFAMHTLTVHGTDLAGKPDTGDAVFVYNSDNIDYFGDFNETQNAFYKGIAKFSVPAGHYWALGLFFSVDKNGNLTAIRGVINSSFTVSGNTTLAINEKSASTQVKVTVPRPAVNQYLNWEVRLTDGLGNPNSWTLGTDGTTPLYVNQTTRRPAVGTLAVFTTARFVSPSTVSRPYTYDLAWENLSGKIGSQRYVASARNLATVHARYFSDVKTAGYLLRFGLFPVQANDGFFVFADQVTAPVAQTEYMSAGADWETQYIASQATLGGGQTDATRRYTAGQVTTEDWNAYPLHTPLDTSVLGNGDLYPTALSASRSGDTLSLDLTPFGDDTPGHTGAGFWPGDAVDGTGGITGSYTLDVNGTTIASGDADQSAQGSSAFTTNATLPAAASTVALTLNADRAVSPYVLSTATSTTWTWRSAHESGVTVPHGWVCTNTGGNACDSEPLLTLDYTVAGLGTNGVAPAGVQVVRLALGHQQLATASRVTAVSAQVSFDGGASWQQAQVAGSGRTRYAVFSAPAGSQVSLKVAAADNKGGAISETILHGYAISSSSATAAYRPACATATAGSENCYVLYSPQNAVARAQAAGFAPAAAAVPAGWGAKSIEAAYKLPVTRAGGTVALVESYDTPKLQTYLNAYRKEYGLSACTSANGCFRKVNEKGAASPLPQNGTFSGWDLEATLDVDMVSAACPRCHILVVEGSSPSYADLAAAENTAARLGAIAISNSYGARENGAAQAYASAYNHPGHTTVVSSGDAGYTAADFPANLTSVTAAGGTELSTAKTTRGYSERVWNSPEGAASSGCSAYVAKPSWQHDTHCQGRTIADVSAVAYDIAIYNTDWATGGWLEVSGTSASSPLIAGVYALAGNATKVKPGYEYAHAGAFFDVTSGNNDWFFNGGGSSCGYDYLCVAKKGYDAPTGLGTPDGTGGL